MYSHTLIPCTCMAQVTKHIVCASPKNIHTTSSSRNVVHLAEPDTTHGHSFSTFPESVLQRAEQPCEDQRPQSGALTELPPFTDYEPNWLAEAWDYRHFTRDGQFTQHEDLDRYTCHTSHFNTYSRCTACSQCTVTFTTRHARLKVQGLCAHEKSSTILCAYTLKHGTRSTCTPFSRSSLILALSSGGHICNREDPLSPQERDSSP